MKKNGEKPNNQAKPYEFPKNRDEFLGQKLIGQIDFVNVNELSGYEHLGIYPFDILIYRRTSELIENELSVFYMRDCECGTGYIGFLYDNFGDISVIDHEGDIGRHKRNEIDIKGVVVGVIRSLKPPVPNSELFVPETVAEITVICDKCKSALTGTPEFIKAQGWELRCGKTLCLNCDLFGGAK